MTRGTRQLFGIAIFALVIIASVALMAIYNVDTHRDARALLSATHAIRVGSSTLQDVEHLVQRFPSYSSKSAGCDPHACDIQLQITNRILRHLHLAPPTKLSIGIRVRDDVVTSFAASFLSGDGGLNTPSAAVIQDESKLTDRPYVSHRESNKPLATLIWLPASISPDERDRLLLFNVDCLTRIGGCSSSRELAPALWTGHLVIRGW